MTNKQTNPSAQRPSCFLSGISACFLKIRSNTAQHTVEYMTLIILVMAGIIIGGPYVIRSWNAQMKSWDDSVIDSFRDPLAEAPPVSIPGCDPQGWVNGGCNTSVADPCNPSATITCGVLERLWKQSYTPAGCECNPYYQYTPDDIVRCTGDSSCCTTWTDVACGVKASPPCPDGQMQQTRTCDVGGVATPEFQCVDNADCVFKCQPDYIPPGACPGSNTGLPSNLPWTATCSCSGAKCQYFSDPAITTYWRFGTNACVSNDFYYVSYNSAEYCWRDGGYGAQWFNGATIVPKWDGTGWWIELRDSSCNDCCGQELWGYCYRTSSCCPEDQRKYWNYAAGGYRCREVRMNGAPTCTCPGSYRYKDWYFSCQDSPACPASCHYYVSYDPTDFCYLTRVFNSWSYPQWDGTGWWIEVQNSGCWGGAEWGECIKYTPAECPCS